MISWLQKTFTVAQGLSVCRPAGAQPVGQHVSRGLYTLAASSSTVAGARPHGQRVSVGLKPCSQLVKWCRRMQTVAKQHPQVLGVPNTGQQSRWLSTEECERCLSKTQQQVLLQGFAVTHRSCHASWGLSGCLSCSPFLGGMPKTHCKQVHMIIPHTVAWAGGSPEEEQQGMSSTYMRQKGRLPHCGGGAGVVGGGVGGGVV